jgi:coenzyme F420-0:L-glutamate ligase/coenzyme F420-1:gamma-L-glutamate ligase
METLHTRRSIRRYTDAPLDRAAIEQLLGAALCAPSAHNSQPWRFAVLITSEAKAQLAHAMAARFRAERLAGGAAPEQVEEEVGRSISRITSAPVVIVACLTMADLLPADDKLAQAEHTMAVQGVAAAIQNLLLAAHAQGLGACWMCAPLFAPDEARAALALPGDWEPQALVTLGHPAKPAGPKTVQPVSTRVIFR